MSLALALTAVLAAAPVQGSPAVGDAEVTEAGAPAPTRDPLRVQVRTDLVDAAATEAGLRARTGDALDLWWISIAPGSSPRTVSAVVEGPDGSVRTRRVALQGETVEDRSRELAASLALLMEQPGDPPRDEQHLPGLPEPPPRPPPRPPIRGWLGLGPRLELGTGLRVEAGPDLMGGVWLARDHVQPIGSVGLSAGTVAGITMLHLRLGAGAAFGAPVGDGRIWLGGHVLGHAMWLRAEELRPDSTWLSSTEIGGLLQYRGRRLFLGLRAGVDLTLPPVSVRGTRGVVRRGIPRGVLGLTFGVVFG